MTMWRSVFNYNLFVGEFSYHFTRVYDDVKPQEILIYMRNLILKPNQGCFFVWNHRIMNAKYCINIHWLAFYVISMCCCSANWQYKMTSTTIAQASITHTLSNIEWPFAKYFADSMKSKIATTSCPIIILFFKAL
jgi:hypothetical protein